jgi:hypothetical protein
MNPPPKPPYIVEKEVTAEQRKRLAGKSLLIGTPMYGGKADSTFVFSMIQLKGLCERLGLPMHPYFIMNESLVQRGRNQIANSFLETDYTHLLFIDADIGFNPADVISMLLADKPIIGGAYPKKSLNFSNAFRAKGQGVPDENLPHCCGNFVYRPKGNVRITPFEMQDSKYLGTGFMMIEKSVLERLKPHFKSYKPNSGLPGEDKKRFYAFFDCDVVNDEYLSEDYFFCEIAAKAGESLWLAPWVFLTHMGTYEFKSCFFCSQGTLIHNIGQPPPKVEPTKTPQQLLAEMEKKK